MPPDCSLILLGGGLGRRFGSNQPKQYLPFLGEPLILYPLKQCLILPVREVIVVCAPNYRSLFTAYPVKYALPGPRRQDSVLSGLQETSSPLVLVHDGARPFVYADDVTSLIAAATVGGAAVLVSPLPYTIKQGASSKTINRNELKIAHTPQCLQSNLLFQGLLQAKQEGILLHDDVEAAELLGKPITQVVSSHPHIKITYPEDFIIAEALALHMGAHE